MNKIILALAICLISTLYSNAQWNYKSCGVLDINYTTSEEFECLWNVSTSMVRSGAILTAIGTSLVIVGLVNLAHSSLYDISDVGMVSVAGGIVIGVIGISVGITGAIRKSQLKNTLYYQNLKSGSLNLSPVIGLNQINGANYLGMSFSLNF